MAKRKTIKSAKGAVRRALSGVMLSVFSIGLLGGTPAALAHGGEDHGEQKVVASAQDGMVSRSARIGDFELLLKHPLLVPDTPASARLFLTQFATNEAVSGGDVTAEIEAPNGAVIEVPVVKTDVAGSYLVELSALAEGDYIFRTTVIMNGKTETATLSGIAVGHAEHAKITGYSWSQALLIAVLFLIGAVLFAALIYLAIRTVKTRPIREEAVAA